MSDVHGVDLDYELADDLPIDGPERLRAIADPLRSLIADLVLERAMSVTELAEIVGRPRGSVAHHVDVLVEAGLLQVVRTRRVRAVEERFYGRTARTYTFGAGPHGSGGVPVADRPPFVDEVCAEYDARAHVDDDAGGFTYRHARIPAHLAREFTERLMALTLEFTRLPRSGDREYGLYVGVFPTNRLGGRQGDRS